MCKQHVDISWFVETEILIIIFKNDFQYLVALSDTPLFVFSSLPKHLLEFCEFCQVIIRVII